MSVLTRTWGAGQARRPRCQSWKNSYSPPHPPCTDRKNKAPGREGACQGHTCVSDRARTHTHRISLLNLPPLGSSIEPRRKVRRDGGGVRGKHHFPLLHISFRKASPRFILTVYPRSSCSSPASGHHLRIGGSGLPGTLFPNHPAIFSSAAFRLYPSRGQLNISVII